MRKLVLVLVVAVVLFSVAGSAFAQQSGEGASMGRDVWKLIAAAFVLGVAAFAGAFGQGKAVAAACTSMGRNPGAAGPVRITMIIGVAFIESLVIYALLIAFVMILSK